MENYIEWEGYKWLTEGIVDCHLAYSPHEDFLKFAFPLRCREFLDCGAHVGKWSLFMSSRAEKVYAIEPNPKNFLVLNRNIKVNKIRNIFSFNLAFSNYLKWTSLTDEGGQSKLSATGTYKILSVDLDNFIDFYLNFPKIDFVKIDTEGEEFNILRGGEKFLKNFNGKLLIEVHEKTYGSPLLKDIVNFLEKRNFQIENLITKEICDYLVVAKG